MSLKGHLLLNTIEYKDDKIVKSDWKTRCQIVVVFNPIEYEDDITLNSSGRREYEYRGTFMSLDTLPIRVFQTLFS
jgi:hypothetical protein